VFVCGIDAGEEEGGEEEEDGGEPGSGVVTVLCVGMSKKKCEAPCTAPPRSDLESRVLHADPRNLDRFCNGRGVWRSGMLGIRALDA
jgi:hypothetical protein